MKDSFPDKIVNFSCSNDQKFSEIFEKREKIQEFLIQEYSGAKKDKVGEIVNLVILRKNIITKHFTKTKIRPKYIFKNKI